MSKRFKGRSAIACRTCHISKLKCSGGNPCQRCQDRGRECIYPVKDRLFTVSESYIRGLEAQASNAKNEIHRHEPTQSSQSRQLPIPFNLASKRLDGPLLVDDCSAERFVQKVKDLSSLTALSEQQLGAPATPTSPTANRYTYAKLNFDCIHSEVSIKLPPRPYALNLLDVFEEGYCDYHWFLRRRFRDRLVLTYADPQSQAGDRNWLCRVSVVLALAETWNRGRSSDFSQTFHSPNQPNAGLSGDFRADAIPNLAVPEVFAEPNLAPPGSELFEQCLLLLKMSLEEPTLEDVEALNLITFYSYSLNRRKTAFFYARQSVSLAQLLLLDKPTSCALQPEERVQDEHRKRIWWTCYCMDRMVSTELGIPPMQEAVSDGLQYPDSSHLLPSEKEEFFEPYLLTAQVELSIIKSKVVDVVTQQLRLTDDADPTEVLSPCTFLIQSWRDGLPATLSFEFDDGIPSAMLELPFHRVLASLYLRYHQCIILLFRPILLQELAANIRRNALDEQQAIPSSSPAAPTGNIDALTLMKTKCLLAARYNCQILVDLWRIGKIAKFGYWEALHLFSGLAILSLSRTVTMSTDHFSIEGGDDAQLSARARDLLEDMARVGNLAARDYKVMLGDVDAMVRRVLDDRERRSCDHTARSMWDPARTSGLEDSAWYPGISDVNLLDNILEEQIWYNIDWENILR